MNLCVPRSCAAVFLCIVGLMGPMVHGETLEQLADADHWKKVVSLCEQRIRSNGRDANAHYFLSKADLSFGNVENAVATAEKAVDLDGSRAVYHAALAEAYAMAAQRANVMKQVVYVHRLKRELDTALSLDPNDLDALLVQMMFTWKAPAVAGGDRRKSLEIVDRLKASHPVWGYLAEAKLMDEQDSGRAQKALERASSLDSSFYLAQVSLAEFYARRGIRLDKAEQLARHCIELDASRSAAYDVLARVYARQGRFTDLDQILKTAREHNSDDLSPFYFAAVTLVETGSGDAARAEQYARTYLSQVPEGRAPQPDAARQLLAAIPRMHATTAPVAASPNATAKQRPGT